MYCGVPMSMPRSRDPRGPGRPGDSETQDLRVAVLIDHDVLRLQVAVNDTKPVGFGEAVTELATDADDLSRAERAAPPDEVLHILARHQFHRQVVHAVGSAEIEESTDIAVRDAPGALHLAREPLECFVVRNQFGQEGLERDLVLSARVDHLVDAAHGATRQFLDHQVAAGEERPSRQRTWPILRGRCGVPCLRKFRRERRAAGAAERLAGRVLRVAGCALHGSRSRDDGRATAQGHLKSGDARRQSTSPGAALPTLRPSSSSCRPISSRPPARQRGRPGDPVELRVEATAVERQAIRCLHGAIERHLLLPHRRGEQVEAEQAVPREVVLLAPGAGLLSATARLPPLPLCSCKPRRPLNA